MMVTAKMLGWDCYYLLLLFWRRGRFPTNEQTSDDKQKRHGAKILVALRRVTIRSSIVCFQPIITLSCVQGAGREVCMVFLYST